MTFRSVLAPFPVLLGGVLLFGEVLVSGLLVACSEEPSDSIPLGASANASGPGVGPVVPGPGNSGAATTSIATSSPAHSTGPAGAGAPNAGGGPPGPTGGNAGGAGGVPVGPAGTGGSGGSNPPASGGTGPVIDSAGGSAGTGSADTGSAGTGAAGEGAGGMAGAAAGGEAGDAGGSGAGGEPTTGGAGGEDGGSDGVECPADATFCSAFEGTELPEGAVYNRNGAPAEWTTDFVVDTAVAHGGESSVRVKTQSEEASSAYKMLAVPTPGSAFWVRAYIRANGVIGQGTTSASEHNRLLVAASGSEPNTTDALEIADDCGLAFNSHDQVYRKSSADGTCDEAGTLRLAADQWYCLEAWFDGSTGDAQLYIDGELQIDAMGWGPAQGAFTHLKFGVDHLHPLERSVWYDDVAVGPTRAGCLD